MVTNWQRKPCNNVAQAERIGPSSHSSSADSFLYTLDSLGSQTTLSEVAKVMERKIGVISKQAVIMEKDGLIKRTQDTPKSNLLRLELTEKGLEMVKLARKSKAIDTILSFLKKEEREQMELILGQILVKAKKYDSKYY